MTATTPGAIAAADESWLVFTRPGCAWCDAAKGLLAGRRVREVDVRDDATVAEAVRAATGLSTDARSVPQIVRVTDGGKTARLVGGHDNLEDLLTEPLLADGGPERWSVFPVRHGDMWDMYRRGVASFWSADEVSLAQDVRDFHERMDDGERRFVKTVLAFFAASDGIVNENLAARFAVEVQPAEARQFYAWQIFNESQHSHVYGLMIDALVRDAAERDTLFSAVRHVPAVRKKAEWAVQWFDASRPFAERLVAFAAVEGVLFSGSFCAVYWLKQRGLMPGLALSNEWISRDEGLHQSFAELLYRDHVARKLPQERVEAIVRGAVDAESEFITDAVPVSLIGMNAALMRQYVRFVADGLLIGLGHAPAYGVANPFPWMELISLSGKTNFFERLPSEYRRAGAANTDDDATRFALDGDF